MQEHGQCEFAFDEIGAESFAGGVVAADEVKAVVVDLVGDSEKFAVFGHFFADCIGASRKMGAKLGGYREEGGGF
jgi:hypothetical protein